jgi:hypothetical protein
MIMIKIFIVRFVLKNTNIMKKLFYILFIAIWAIACTGKKTENNTAADQAAEMVTYKYKVSGLQDSIIADSVWRIIFQVEGVDKLIISKSDCTASFTVDPKLVDSELLVKEITKKGGVVLN